MKQLTSKKIEKLKLLEISKKQMQTLKGGNDGVGVEEINMG